MERVNNTQKIRQLVRRLNNDRKIQAKKIDILCNDLISAHRSFIKGLRSLSFAADFYESIIGKRRLDEILFTASDFIKNEVDNVELAFFIRKDNGFEKLDCQGIGLKDKKNDGLENCFTRELVENICKSNKLMALDDMLEMGLQARPAMISQVSAFAIPLARSGTSLGFILLYRASGQNLSISELKNVASVATGLSGAIESCGCGLKVSSNS